MNTRGRALLLRGRALVIGMDKIRFFLFIENLKYLIITLNFSN